MTVCLEQSSQRLSSAPSCISLQSNSSMRLPIRFRNNYSDGSYSSGQRERCRARTHRRMHTQPCVCWGGRVTPCCRAGPQNHGTVLAQCADKVMDLYSSRENCSVSLFWILGLLFGTVVITAVNMRFTAPSHMQEPKTSQELSLMLLGRSGAGKSASGNTLLGRQAFEDSFSFSPVTKDCKSQSGVVSGRNVKVIDSPGPLEWAFSNCYAEGFSAHVFLLVIRLGRIKEEERDGVRHISEHFGSGALNHTLVLFTGGDLLGKKDVSELLDHSHPVLKELIGMCGGGYHVFNNKVTDDRQAEELLVKMEAIVNFNSVYTIRADTKNVHNVKNVTGEETLCIFCVICVVLLVVDLVRVVLSASVIVVAKRVDVYVTQVSKNILRHAHTKSDIDDKVRKVYITDDMKEAEIHQTEKETTESSGVKKLKTERSHIVTHHPVTRKVHITPVTVVIKFIQPPLK
ncbi:uncharacterized protein LOC143491228 isoform X2 [Brachyhypopomus gauderio]